MKTLLWIAAFGLLAACGGNESSSTGTTSAAREDTAGTDRSTSEAREDVDIGAGEEISPQMELDSSETRFEVDSLGSAERQSDPDNESF